MLETLKNVGLVMIATAGGVLVADAYIEYVDRKTREKKVKEVVEDVLKNHTVDGGAK